MEPSRDDILGRSSTPIHPELGAGSPTSTWFASLEIVGGDVTVTIALTVAGCPLRASFEEQVAEHVGSRPRSRPREALPST